MNFQCKFQFELGAKIQIDSSVENVSTEKFLSLFSRSAKKEEKKVVYVVTLKVYSRFSYTSTLKSL